MLPRFRKHLRRGEAGFTLIELMIVILVILILAAVLIPQLGLSQERARKAKCVSNQRNIETAVQMWKTDNVGTNYTGGTMAANSNPTAGMLTGLPQYALSGVFIEPDHSAVLDGSDYYLSNGASGNPSAVGNAVPANPSSGHIACAYDGTADPWVASYDGTGQGGAGKFIHTRGATASP